MCLVDDDGEVAVAHVLDGVTDKRKLLYRGDDDALAALDGILQVTATVGMGDDFPGLSECSDVGGYLLVQESAVGHYDG